MTDTNKVHHLNDQNEGEKEKVRVVKKTEYLKYAFTEQEKKEIGENLANAVSERNEFEAELTSVKKDFQSKIALCEKTIAECAEKIRSGYEMRNIDCEERFDYETGIVDTFRMDTCAFVRERKMTQEERQKELPL
jgi:hypothetical protein